VYTLLLIVATLGVFRLEFPYLPQQVTLLNKLTIGIPALVITLSRTTAARAGHRHFLWDIGRFALATGSVVGLAGLAVLLLSAFGFHESVEVQRTMLLSTLILLCLANLPRVLTAEGEQLTSLDRHFFWWIPAAIVMYLGAMYIPLAADFFQLARLTLSQWLVVVAVAGLGMLFCLMADRIRLRRRPVS
jgi:magnesium-transporting ATPase (P-type)